MHGEAASDAAKRKNLDFNKVFDNSKQNADVVKWYTRSLEVAVPLKSVEVRVLSSAPGSLAQLVRAPRLHRGGQRVKSSRVHNMLES